MRKMALIFLANGKSVNMMKFYENIYSNIYENVYYVKGQLFHAIIVIIREVLVLCYCHIHRYVSEHSKIYTYRAVNLNKLRRIARKK